MSRKIFACAVVSATLVIVPVTSIGSVIAPARAVPGDVANPVDLPVVTLPGSALGSKSELFITPDNPARLSVSVPVGLNAVRLRGTINPPLNIDAGILDIADIDGKLLATIDLPPGASSRPAVPLDVDLSAAAKSGAAVDLTFTLRPRFDPQNYTNTYCWPRRELMLSNISAVFTGSEAPTTTIAGFFPPVLQRATIYTPTDADADEQQAVLALVSNLARRYHDQPTVITVVNQRRGATPPAAGDLARSAVVERAENASLKVENPGTPNAFLRISGRGADLSAQLSLFATDLQGLAQTDTARVDQAGASDTRPSGDTMTFRELKMSGSTDVLRTSNVSVGVGRTSLGTGRVDGVQVHLLADYTPVAKDDSASVVIHSGGVVVYRASLDNTGRLDATFDLDRQKIGQFVDLDMALTYTPHESCGWLTAMTFEIDQRSTLTVHRGGAPLRGFSAVPSEFSPKFMVAMDGTSPGQLAHVARLVASIARSSGIPVTPQVVDVKTAADSNTGAVIMANSAALKQTSLNPPVSGDGATVSVGLPTELRANIGGGGLGSLQAFADLPRNRSVLLLTTTGPWPLVEPLFGYLDRVDGDVSKLTGDVLAAGVAGDPVSISVRTADNVAAPQESSDNSHRSVLVGAGVVVVALVGAAAAVLWRRRRVTTAPNDSSGA